MTRDLAVLAVVDIPDSEHGCRIAQCARVGSFSPCLRWIEPDLQLPERLAVLSGVSAVAIPIAVKGATSRDRFTQRMLSSIEALGDRNIPVFVAAGNRRSNLLAQARGAVRVAADVNGASSSEACVRKAVAHLNALLFAEEKANA